MQARQQPQQPRQTRDRQQSKERQAIDRDKTIKHLSRLFRKVTAGLPTADKNGSDAAKKNYAYQVDFAHLVNEIELGPVFSAAIAIAECNKLIDAIIKDSTK